MKKIAEMHIGSGIINKIGTPSAFISYDNENHEYKAFCGYCGNLSYFGKHYDEKEYACPVCGVKHEGYDVFFNHDQNQPMPYKMRLSIIDFKDKIELRVVYNGIRLNSDYHYYGEIVKNIHEKYVFDFNGKKSYWQYDSDRENIHKRQELGYIQSFDEMKEMTALWYISANHVCKGSQTAFLKILRNAVTHHMKELGFQRKNLFIPTKKELKLYASILAIAHKVRFWDAEVIPYSGTGKLSFHQWLKEVLRFQSLPKGWEKERDKQMKNGMNYTAAFITALKLTNTPFVRKRLNYENLYSLCRAFSLPTTDMACLAFPIFKEMSRVNSRRFGLIVDDCQKIDEICEFMNIFYPLYPEMKASRIIRQWSETYRDMIRLWYAADQITKENYEHGNIPFSKLHDWFSIEVTKQKGREVIFDLDEALVKALQQSVRGYQFRCIKRKSELKEIGMTLQNCALSYASIIGKLEQLVVVTADDGKILALLEIRKGNIVQARLYANRQVSDSEEVNKACIEYLELTKLSCVTKDIDMSVA